LRFIAIFSAVLLIAGCGGGGGGGSDLTLPDTSGLDADATVLSSTEVLTSANAAVSALEDIKIDARNAASYQNVNFRVEKISSPAVERLSDFLELESLGVTTRSIFRISTVVEPSASNLSLILRSINPAGLSTVAYALLEGDEETFDGDDVLQPMSPVSVNQSEVSFALPAASFQKRGSSFRALIVVGSASVRPTAVATKLSALQPAGSQRPFLLLCPLGSGNCTETSMFNPQRRTKANTRTWSHQGIDLRAAVGSPIYAVADGYVKGGRSRAQHDAQPRKGGVILELEIETAAGKHRVRYLHLESISSALLSNGVLRTGPTVIVKKGDVIGTSGATSTTTPHLHFELRDSTGLAKDPFPHFYGPDGLAVETEFGGSSTSVGPQMVLSRKVNVNHGLSLFQINIETRLAAFDIPRSDVGNAVEPMSPLQYGTDPTRKICVTKSHHSHMYLVISAEVAPNLISTRDDGARCLPFAFFGNGRTRASTSFVGIRSDIASYSRTLEGIAFVDLQYTTDPTVPASLDPLSNSRYQDSAKLYVRFCSSDGICSFSD
jgi:murein DD-endopeptidase MepM/ murein hydrolase activator NlpD